MIGFFSTKLALLSGSSLFLAATALSTLTNKGCDNADEVESKGVETQQSVYAKTQPVPFFKWSQDRDNLIQIYKMKNESRATYSVVRSAGTGEILWDCPSIGFPLPADTQLTNPLQRVYGEAIIEQAEPNGLFSSKNTDGTYVICVLPDGTLSPQYSEAKVDVFTRPVKVEKGRVVFIDGAPSMRIEKAP